MRSTRRAPRRSWSRACRHCRDPPGGQRRRSTLARPDGLWPFAQVIAGGGTVTVDLDPDAVPPYPVAGRGTRPPARALVVPIAQQGQARPAAVFIAGLNPYRPLDDAYRSFVSLFVGQIAAGLANARRYEEERRRAEALAGDRSREDRVLLQRQPRVPHAADADARADRGRAGAAAARCDARAARDGPPQRAAAAEAGEHAARLLADRGRPRPGAPTSRPTSRR